MDYTNVFTNLNIFPSREALQAWAREQAMLHNIGIVVKRSNSGSGRKKPHVYLACERNGDYRVLKGRKRSKNDSQKRKIEENKEIAKESKKMKRDIGTKKCGCPFLLYGIEQSFGEWILKVRNGMHNHPVVLNMGSHSYDGRLTKEEEVLVKDLTEANVQAKDALRMVKSRNVENHSTIHTLHNVRKKYKVIERGGLSQLQRLMKELERKMYVHYYRTSRDDTTLSELFFAHPTGIQLFRAFPQILLIDCTYKKNRYGMPYFEMVGVTSTGMTFSVGSVYLNAEKEDNYAWALGVLKLVLDDACVPRVVITDRDLALMNAVSTTFPESTHLLCRWHIDKNVLAKCKEKFTSRDEWKSFYEQWRAVVNADELEVFEEAIRLLMEAYPEDAVDYVMNQWINPYKEKFVSFWINKVMHYENTTTNRVESHHESLKKMLGNSLRNFETCWAKTETLLVNSYNEIKKSFEHSVHVAQQKFKSVYYRDLRGLISVAALNRLHEEIKQLERRESDPLLCKHYLRKVCGLPCTHEINEYMESGKPIPLEAVDRFWRKLDMDPILKTADEGDVRADMDNRFEEAMQNIVMCYQESEGASKSLLLRKAVELADLATTNLVRRPGSLCTRPKRKQPTGIR